MNDKVSNRNEYIDWLKGFAIFLVVLGHCWLLDRGIFWLIYRFHMPLFFSISGYLFSSKRKFKDFVKIKFKKLIIPYIIFFVMSYLITNFCINHISIKRAIKILLLNGKYLISVNNWAIWYLPLFFLASLLFYFVTKINNKKIYTAVIVIAGILTVPSYIFFNSRVIDGKIPWSINVLPAAIFYMGMGYAIKNIKSTKFKINEKLKGIISTVLLSIGIIISIGNSNQIISISSYKYLITSILFLQFIILVTKNNKNKIMVYLGKNSLVILGIHRVILKLFEVYKFDTFLIKYNFTEELSALILTLLCIFIICVINEVYSYILKKSNIFSCKIKIKKSS